MKEMYSNLLILLLAFEKLWLKYFFTEGLHLYRESVRIDSQKLTSFLFDVYEKDHSIFNTKSLYWNDLDDEQTVRKIVTDFRDWAQANNEMKYPKFFYEASSLEAGQYLLNCFFHGLEAYLSTRSGLDVIPNILMTSYDTALHENHIKWTQHVSYRVIDIIDDDFLNKISLEDTIVIVADIRNSQDLITYSPDLTIYKNYIMEVVNMARQIITQNYGIFDRFTGDGFICYFNKYICSKFDCNYLYAALNACNIILQNSNRIFQEWVEHIRKLPSNSIGLSIGMDSGLLSFSEVDNHFFAIGVPCVWATRACDAGNADDIVLNNIIYHQYYHYFKDLNDSDIKTEEISSFTKTGESYKAYVVNKDWRNKHLKSISH
jgi:class 3 adenylate cyclase